MNDALVNFVHHRKGFANLAQQDIARTLACRRLNAGPAPQPVERAGVGGNPVRLLTRFHLHPVLNFAQEFVCARQAGIIPVGKPALVVELAQREKSSP